MTTATGTKPKRSGKGKGEPVPVQQQMEGDGFPDPLPKEIQRAVGEYLTCKREAAEAAEAKGNAMQKLIELGHKHKLERIPIEGENKFVEIGVKDTCKIKTKPKDQEKRRRNAEAGTGEKPVYEKD